MGIHEQAERSFSSTFRHFATNSATFTGSSYQMHGMLADFFAENRRTSKIVGFFGWVPRDWVFSPTELFTKLIEN